MVNFTLNLQQVNEDDGTVTVIANLDVAPTETVTVEYQTVTGTAVNPNDYLTTTGVLQFLATQTTRSFTIPLTNDVFPEPTEDFTVVLLNPNKLTIGTQFEQTIRILDDDSDPGPFGFREVVAAYAGDGRDPGRFGDLAHDSLGNLHAAYYETENRDLKYAYGTRDPNTGEVTWDIQVVDFEGNVGQYVSIAVTSANVPVITYHDATNGVLKVAYDQNADGDFEQDGVQFGVNDFTGFREIAFVDVTSAPTGLWTSVAVDVFDNFHVSYKNDANQTVRYAHFNGAAWSIETLPAVSSINGAYSSIVVDNRQAGTGIIVPYVFFRDEENLSLVGLVRSPITGWVSLSALSSTVDSGRFIDAVLSEADDRIYVSHQAPLPSNQFEAKLRLVVIDLSGNTIDEEVLSCDPISQIALCDPSFLIGDWGYYTSIALDKNELPYIAHQNQRLGDLLIDHRTTDTITVNAPPAFYADMGRAHTRGNVGSFTSSSHYLYTDPTLLTDLDTIHVSFYDDSHEAMRLSPVVNDLVTTTSTTYIDGPKVGQWSSVKIDSTDTSIISYYDDPLGALMLTRRTGPAFAPWSTPIVVDDSTASRNRPTDIFFNTDTTVRRADFSQTGQEVSMVVTASDTAHMAYYDALRRELNYSWVDLTTNVATRLVVDTNARRGRYVDQAESGGEFLVAYYQDFDPDFNASLSTDPFGNGPSLRAAVGDGLTSGTWSLELIDNSGDVGRYVSAAYDSLGTAHVSYYDGTNHNLKYAFRDSSLGANWIRSTVADTPNIDGLYTSIAIDPQDDQPAIAFYDVTDAALMFAKFDGFGWSIDVVEDQSDVGSGTKIVYGADPAIVYIVYHDAANEALKVASRTLGVTGWTVEIVETGGVGINPDALLDSLGRLRMTYYDVEHGDLLYRETTNLPRLGVETPAWLRYD